MTTKPTQELLSKCHKAPLTFGHGYDSDFDRNTSFCICSICGEPCNTYCDVPTPSVSQDTEEWTAFINKEIDFLTDHWTENDQPPFSFGGWREEVVADIVQKIAHREKQAKRELIEKIEKIVNNPCISEVIIDLHKLVDIGES